MDSDEPPSQASSGLKTVRDPRVVAAGAIIILATTLWPLPPRGHSEELPFWCVLCGEYGTLDVLLNVLLFVPLGAGLRSLGASHRWVVILAFSLSLVVEALQAAVIPGRHAAFGDLLANSAGGLLGARVHDLWGRVARPRPATARTYMALAFAGAIAVPSLATLFLRPSPPSTPVWWGQWAHELGGIPPFPGRVLDARLGTEPVPDGRLVNQVALRRVYTGSRVRFVVHVTAGGSAPGPAQVAALADGGGGWVAAIWQDGEDAVLTLRHASAGLGFRSPEARVAGAFGVPPGTRLELGIEGRPGRIGAWRLAGPGHDSIGVRYALGPGHAWALLWPWSVAFERPPVGRTVLWLLGWFLLTTFATIGWARIAGHSPAGILLAAIALPVTLGVVPWVASQPAAPAWQWGAALVGSLLGAAAGTAAGNRPEIPQRSSRT